MREASSQARRLQKGQGPASLASTLPLQPGTLWGLVEAACQADGVDGWSGGEADVARDLAGRYTQNISPPQALPQSVKADEEPSHREDKGHLRVGARFESCPKSQEKDDEINNSESNSGPSWLCTQSSKPPLETRASVTPTGPMRKQRPREGKFPGGPDSHSPTFPCLPLPRPFKGQMGEQRPGAVGTGL